MATKAINANDVDIPDINFAQQSSDPDAPSAGRWRLFFKSGGLYARSNAGGVIGPFLTSVSGLIIAEIDGVPSGTPTTFQLPNGTLSDQGSGVYRYTPAQLLTIAEIDANPSGTPTTLQFPNGTLSDQGGGVYRYTPAAGGGYQPVGAEVTRTTNQGLTGSSTWDSISWETEVHDDDGMVDLGTQATRVTVPRAGWYHVHGESSVSGGSGGWFALRIAVNGSTYYTTQRSGTTADAIPWWGASAILYLAQNDYIELQAASSVTSRNAVTPRLAVLGYKPT